MTPRTIEENIFEKIRQQKSSLSPVQDLRLDSALFDLPHPKVLMAQSLFENDHEQKPTDFFHDQWKAAFYSSVPEAESNHPGIKLQFKGYPFKFWQFLESKARAAIIDFAPLGVAVLSKDELSQSPSEGLHRFTLPPWVTYALSPELWGPVGKWPRFHERLHTLFDKYHLLNGEDFPGYYPLKTEARSLEKYEFIGSTHKDQFILNLNWTFSLTALEKIEDVIQREH